MKTTPTFIKIVLRPQMNLKNVYPFASILISTKFYSFLLKRTSLCTLAIYWVFVSKKQLLPFPSKPALKFQTKNLCQTPTHYQLWTQRECWGELTIVEICS